LAGRKQVFCKGVRVDEGKDGAGKTAPGSANADGAEFVKVGRVLVKSKKATVCQEFGDSRGDVVVENESQNLGECFEAFLIF
jgi:orotidine-5'-phosphate decarboxylase